MVCRDSLARSAASEALPTKDNAILHGFEGKAGLFNDEADAGER